MKTIAVLLSIMKCERRKFNVDYHSYYMFLKIAIFIYTSTITLDFTLLNIKYVKTYVIYKTFSIMSVYFLN